MLKPIMIFDGYVIEFFFDELQGVSKRVHIGHIRSIEIIPVSRGKEKYSLQMKGEYQFVAVDVSEEALPKVQELVRLIEEARVSLQL